MNELQQLSAISPVDGRYAAHTSALVPFFSEAALIRYRVRIEALYLLWFANLSLEKVPTLTPNQAAFVRSRFFNLSNEDVLQVKRLEKTTNHDVKAVEYFMRNTLIQEKFPENLLAYIHFGLTSQDINNTALPLAIKESFEKVLAPKFLALLKNLESSAIAFSTLPMLARTHGQPASPTTLGKEWMVFVERLNAQWKLLQNIPFQCKMGGATGNFNAHHIAFPELAWDQAMDRFCAQELGLQRQRFTTQIEHYDMLGAYCDAWKRICIVLVDFARDVWQYISLDYFQQEVVAGEVGSSAMPHKVNPIDFENAEGNLLWAVSMLGFFPEKLPISRLQRDLTDSTVMRNFGLPFAHVLIALASLSKGLGKIHPNYLVLEQDLEKHPEVLAEALQTVLRKEGVYDGYERIKALTRTGKPLDLQTLRACIEQLPIPKETKEKLLRLEPKDYLGLNLISQ